MKRSKTPTFFLELPLATTARHAKYLRAHFEAARCLYNALLGEALKRLQLMQSDDRWQAARAIPKTKREERAEAFNTLRITYGFSEYALYSYAKEANCSWVADHIDAVTAQALATRAYQAVNKVCLGKAKKVRFKSKGRGLDSIEGKSNKQGLRFILQPPEEGNTGWFVWRKERIPAVIDWNDPVVKHGLDHRIKYVRLIRRKASSSRAQSADCQSYRYYVQLILEGHPYQKKKGDAGKEAPKHPVGKDIVGLDLGPSTIAIVPREGTAHLLPLCGALNADIRKKRRLQRKLDRQRRANNPQNYDEKGRIKKPGKGQRHIWHNSKGYQATRRQLANQERKLVAHRKSLHGALVHFIISLGNQIHLEKISYKAWQKQYGKSVGLYAPGMLIAYLKRTVASTGGTLVELPTHKAKLSQYCHGCGNYEKKPLSQRWHHCACGIGPVQRDLYSAFLAAYMNPTKSTTPSIAQHVWESVDLRLRAAIEVIQQRAKEGDVFPQSMGIPRARARLPKSLGNSQLELVYRRGRLEALR
jgi:hypothetical protein